MKKFIAHIRESDEDEQSLESHLFGVADKAQSFAEKIQFTSKGKNA